MALEGTEGEKRKRMTGDVQRGRQAGQWSGQVCATQHPATHTHTHTHTSDLLEVPTDQSKNNTRQVSDQPAPTQSCKDTPMYEEMGVARCVGGLAGEDVWVCGG